MAARIAAGPPEDLRPRACPSRSARSCGQGMAKDPAGRQSDDGAARAGSSRRCRPAPASPSRPWSSRSDGGEPAPPRGGRARRRPTTPRRSRPRRWCRAGGVILLLGRRGRAGRARTGADSRPTCTALPGRFRRRRRLVRAGRRRSQPSPTSTGGTGWRCKQAGQQFLSDTAFRGPVYGKPLTGLGDVSVRVDGPAGVGHRAVRHRVPAGARAGRRSTRGWSGSTAPGAS